MTGALLPRGDAPLVIEQTLTLPNGARVSATIELLPTAQYGDMLELTEVVQRSVVWLGSAAGAARPDPPF